MELRRYEQGLGCSVDSGTRGWEGAAMKSVNAKMKRLARVAILGIAANCCGHASGQEHKGTETGGKHKDLRWAPPNVEAPLAASLETASCSLSAVLELAGARAMELTATLEEFHGAGRNPIREAGAERDDGRERLKRV